ncbi:hypothetical protein CONPUDRAFT_140427 [Coniophora puteana RWD-64-598 SS2]|uniref:SPRY domain-containing protein n=1 Tax=Coniophora puteana (strain RWD-64-598) TaxID=741705 RepID=R7SEP5_CONPW|nr:uncharacterized protein CONPUDRAFT_140427 [Coniophora puteana RWD-64-598 SS2]EIW74648.1 hypothetical protein CONPUDRAFT_140427 [Coniophora puteana RWD-64-598 SS2]
MWGLDYPNEHAQTSFRGFIRNPNAEGEGRSVTHVRSFHDAEDPERDFCLLGNIPLLAGKYDASGKKGVYYEVKVIRMTKGLNGIVAVGFACKPYPLWRLPGWNRLSAGFHLDDLRVFYEDPTGGHDYCNTPSTQNMTLHEGDVVGCGIRHPGRLFFTHNGRRLGDVTAYPAVFMPPREHDVYAAVGVEGECELEVNFGADMFVWKEGNEEAWSPVGHVGGRMEEGGGMNGEQLPTYSLV